MSKVVYCIIQDEFGHTSEPRVCKFAASVENIALLKFKEHFIGNFVKGSDPTKWRLTLNGVSVDGSLLKKLKEFPANEGEHPYLFVLSFERPMAVAKRSRDERKTYSVAERIRKILDGNLKAFIEEKSSNGMETQRILTMLQILTHRLQSVQTATEDYLIVYQVMPLTRLPDHRTLVCSPYFSTSHVSLVCKVPGRFIHLDASSSVTHHNRGIFEHLSGIKYSLTYIPYQLFDDVKFSNYPGGNCSCFTLFQTIRMIMDGQRYINHVYAFDEFWARFTLVCEYTRDLEHVMKMSLSTVINVIYMHRYDGIKKNCLDFKEAIDYMDIDLIKMVLRRCKTIPEVLKTIRELFVKYELLSLDYTADVCMLDMFADNQRGFQDVSLIGNAIYLFLKDTQEQGFIAERFRNLLK